MEYVNAELAFSTDSLLERTKETAILEALIEFNPDAPIFTFAHNPENLLGPITYRNVRSTFLSKLVKKKLNKSIWQFLLPHSSNGLSMRPYKKILSFSHGIGQNLPLSCLKKDQSVINYFYDDHFLNQAALFGGVKSKWIEEYKDKSCIHLASSFSLKKKLEDYGFFITDVVYPFFNIAEFMTVNRSESIEPFFIVQTNGVDKRTVKEVKKILAKKNIKTEFVDDPCDGELASFFSSASLFIDLSINPFPEDLLKANCTQVPVVCLNNDINREFCGVDGAFYINAVSELEEIIQNQKYKIDQETLKSLRSRSLKFSQGKFVKKFQQFL